jgi:heme/copper-type cytochrome/quinol oxidase subunit 2
VKLAPSGKVLDCPTDEPKREALITSVPSMAASSLHARRSEVMRGILHPRHQKQLDGSALLTRNVIILLLALCATTAGSWDRQMSSGGDIGKVKTIDVIASRFRFEPATISVVQGDSVRLRLRSADRTHAFAIKAFRVKALIPKMGDEVTVDFVADRAGTFDFTCAEYCGIGHSGMKGRLVVLARGK